MSLPISGNYVNIVTNYVNVVTSVIGVTCNYCEPGQLRPKIYE